MKSVKCLIMLACVATQAFVVDSKIEHFTKDHSVQYNALPTPEKASAALHADEKKFDNFKTAFAALVDEYDVDHLFGLRLIHNHFLLPTDGDQQVMVEFFAPFENKPASITRRMKLDEKLVDDAAAASWMFVDGKVVPFEFSIDPAVKMAREFLGAQPEFMAKAQALIEANEYQKWLAPAILARNNFKVEEGLTALERSFEEVGSVVQGVKPDEVPNSNVIITSWDFSRPLVLLNAEGKTVGKGPRQVGCRFGGICTPEPKGGHKGGIGWSHDVQTENSEDGEIRLGKGPRQVVCRTWQVCETDKDFNHNRYDTHARN